MFDPHTVSLAGLQNSAYVRFSVLALSSIFFLVDPFAALPTFLAVTAGADAQRRKKMAWKASLTALVVLSAFAVAGQFIFRMFGITLPAFEIAGGIILLLIGLDMLQAKRSPTQESQVEAAEAALKEDGCESGFNRNHCGNLLPRARQLGPRGPGDGRDGCEDPRPHHGVAAGGAGGSI